MKDRLNSLKVPKAYWPTSGVILWVSPHFSMNALEKSAIYEFGREVLCKGDQRNLMLLNANTHPDFYLVQPEKEGHSIKIDQIRALIEWSDAKPQIASQKLAVIAPAEALNVQAANALLKTLEELPESSLFILMCRDVATILPTILSRCHIIRDRVLASIPSIEDEPLAKQVIQDLEAIRNLKTEPTAVAVSWIQKDIQRTLYWMLVSLGDFLKQASETGNLFKVKKVFDFVDRVLDANRAVQNKTNANEQLLIETLLIQYMNNRHYFCLLDK